MHSLFYSESNTTGSAMRISRGQPVERTNT